MKDEYTYIGINKDKEITKVLGSKTDEDVKEYFGKQRYVKIKKAHIKNLIKGLKLT